MMKINLFANCYELIIFENCGTSLISFQIDQLVYNLHGDTAKIDFPTIKEYTKDIDERAYKENNITVSIVLESILLTRLDEEVYCGLINVMNTFDPSTSDNDIKKALVS